MLEVYSEDEERMLVRMHGVMKSFYHQIMILSKSEAESEPVDLNNPVWHIAFIKRNYRLDAYRRKVLDTVKRSCTFDKYGLTYNDLMKMDIPTFDEIRAIIIETDKALSASNQTITNSIAELNSITK